MPSRADPPPVDPRGLLMLAFDGFELPGAMADRLAVAPAAGVTLFRHGNVSTAAQVRALTDSIQAARGAGRADDGPLLVAADQEGGQLLALGDVATAFPGNMAIGAAGDPALAERVGRAVGLELRALGVNVAYAPVCDLATNPANASIGIRSFGSEPAAVAALAAATVRGLRSAGVAAAAKHFPGLGDAGADSHLGLPVVAGDAALLRGRELVPFRAAIEAGADIVMSAHLAVPGLTGDPARPATLSGTVMTGLLRDELGFRGLAISDALDMAALPQGDHQVDAVVAGLDAGLDLLLCAPDEAARERIEAGLVAASATGRLDPDSISRSLHRLARLRRRLRDAPDGPPPTAIVRSPGHEDLAREVAARSLTLVRDDAGLLPLRLDPETRVLAIMPRPADLTPADTSSTVPPGLADAVRRYHGRVTELVTAMDPDDADVAAASGVAGDHDLVIAGTIAAQLHPGQARLVGRLLATGTPIVTVALRTPFDLAVYPAAATHVCAFGLLPASLEALAAALFGRAGHPGRLPAPIAGIAAPGHGLVR